MCTGKGVQLIGSKGSGGQKLLSDAWGGLTIPLIYCWQSVPYRFIERNINVVYKMPNSEPGLESVDGRGRHSIRACEMGIGPRAQNYIQQAILTLSERGAVLEWLNNLSGVVKQ